jgi:putative spermidine/putrescine transport system permease protein
MIRDQGLTSKIWRFAIWALAILFVLNLLAVIAAVIVNSFATRWLGTWLPAGWTTRWYFSAWKEFQLSSVVLVTFEIVFTVVIISGILGVTTAYALARRNFPGKGLVVLLFLLPLLIPPLTYGIPLATVLYRLGLGGTFWGVVLINIVPSLPFVVLVMIPFIEQIDPRIEAAARVFGAGTTSLFLRILLPLLLPGIRRPGRPVHRCDGGGLHGHDTVLAGPRAAVRQPDADRRAGKTTKCPLARS